MKRCKRCGKCYDNSWGVCLDCGIPLDDISGEKKTPTDEEKQVFKINIEKDRIKKIAHLQKWLCWAIPVSFITGFTGVPGGIFFILVVYDLAAELKIEKKWLYILGTFIPFGSIVVFILLFTKATKELVKNGIKVNFMGCRGEDLNKFLSK